jgi:hypothetical protein
VFLRKSSEALNAARDRGIFILKRVWKLVKIKGRVVCMVRKSELMAESGNWCGGQARSHGIAVPRNDSLLEYYFRVFIRTTEKSR